MKNFIKTYIAMTIVLTILFGMVLPIILAIITNNADYLFGLFVTIPFFVAFVTSFGSQND